MPQSVEPNHYVVVLFSNPYLDMLCLQHFHRLGTAGCAGTYVTQRPFRRIDAIKILLGLTVCELPGII